MTQRTVDTGKSICHRMCYHPSADVMQLTVDTGRHSNGGATSANQESENDSSSYLLFWGFDLNKDTLKGWIGGCLPDVSYPLLHVVLC